MDSTYMFNDISLEESYDIDGGSTKVAAIVLAIVGSVCAIGAYVTSKTGHPVASATLTCVAAVCGLAAAWLAIAPSL